MQALGVDVGSSSIKAAVLDLETGVIGEVVQVPFPGPLPGRPAGHVEIDADAVAEECHRLIGQLVRQSSPEAILFCGQHGGCVLVDAALNRVSPYVSWRDLRATEPSDGDGSPSVLQATAADLGDERRQTIGNELAPGGTVALLSWLRRRGVLPANVTPLGIAEYVLLRLGGGLPVIEPTCAIGMIDFATRGQPTAVYERLGLGGVRWPVLKSYREAVGEMAAGGRRIPMYPVLGDHQCALLGAGLGSGELSVNVSTGSQVSLLTRLPELSPRYQTRCYFDGHLLNTVTYLPAGRALNALVDLLTEIPRAAGLAIDDPWQWIARLVESSGPADLRAKISFFPGPMGSRGEITNISLDNLRTGPLFHAAFANMADNYREAARWIDPAGASTNIVFSGGLAQKFAMLRSETAARFPLPHRCSDAVEETLTGLLRAGRVVCGLAASAIPPAA